MKRTKSTARMLATLACLAVIPTGLLAATIYVDDDAAGPGDGSIGDPFPTIQAAIDDLIATGADNDVIYINGGNYNVGEGNHAIVDGLTLNNITIQGDPNDRPVLERGIIFQNDTHTGLIIENLVIEGKVTTDAAAGYLLDFKKNGSGRTDVTIRNCKFDGQNVGVYPGSSTNGIYLSRAKGTFIFDDNEITALTGNVMFSPTGAGSISATDFANGYVLDYAYVRRNNIYSSTGAIDTRGYHPDNSNDPASDNPIVYFVDNSFTDLPASPAASGGAFKVFHCKEGYFYGNTIQATNVTGNNYGENPCVAGTNPDVVHAAGVLFVNVGKLIVAGNTFIDCLQAVANDPNPSQSNFTQNNSLPKELRIYNNTFQYCEVALFLTSLTLPGYQFTTANNCGTLQADPSWDSAWNQAPLIYDNNFIENDTAIYSQAPDNVDLPIDASDNFWGDAGGPQPGDIDLEYESDGGTVDTSNPETELVLADGDGDGLPDHEEILIYNTLPDNPDSDGDTFSDGLEVALGSNPNDINDTPAGAPTPGADSDDDGYSDEYELTVGTNPNDGNDSPTLGDADGNGNVDNVDALVVTAVVVGATGFQPGQFNFNAMDVNQDGTINNLDAIQLVNFFLGNIDTLPYNP